eukprot:scaffold1326_cov51-Cyclotella_meneghiniana.AAC.12
MKKHDGNRIRTGKDFFRHGVAGTRNTHDDKVEAKIDSYRRYTWNCRPATCTSIYLIFGVSTIPQRHPNESIRSALIQSNNRALQKNRIAL